MLYRTIHTLAVGLPAGISSALLKSSQNVGILTQRNIQTSSVCCRKNGSRGYPPSKMPSSTSGRWVEKKTVYEMYKYTTEPVPMARNGGRGPNGHIWNYRRGGGLARKFYMVDYNRGNGAEPEKPLIERVHEIHKDPYRSALIAKVAGGERKRYIVATQNMKVGDLIQSSKDLTRTAVRANEGDSYPLGSLPIGTLVNCVEIFPEAGGIFARSAGVMAQLVRKIDDKCVVRLPSKREIQVAATCQATVGRVSNIDHNKQQLGKAGAARWLGIRPSSGLWHRKDGYAGRKIRPIKSMRVYDKPEPPKPKVVQCVPPVHIIRNFRNN